MAFLATSVEIVNDKGEIYGTHIVQWHQEDSRYERVGKTGGDSSFHPCPHTVRNGWSVPAAGRSLRNNPRDCPYVSVGQLDKPHERTDQ